MAEQPKKTEEVNGKAVAALIFSLAGLALWCPCIGSILGIVLGSGENSGVGKAGVILGWIGVGLMLLFVLAFCGQVALMALLEGF